MREAPVDALFTTPSTESLVEIDDAALDACSSDTPTHNTRTVVCMYDDDPNTYEFNVDTQQSRVIAGPSDSPPYMQPGLMGEWSVSGMGTRYGTPRSRQPSLHRPTQQACTGPCTRWRSGSRTGQVMSGEQAAELSKWCHWVCLYKESAICTTAHQKKADD